MNAHQRRVVKRSNTRNVIKEVWDKFNEDTNNIESIYNLIQKDHQVNGRFTLCDYVNEWPDEGIPRPAGNFLEENYKPNDEIQLKIDALKEKNPIYAQENMEEILESARALEFWTEKEKEIKALKPMLEYDKKFPLGYHIGPKGHEGVKGERGIPEELESDEMGLPYKKDGMFTKLKKYFKGETK